ncbi:MAG: hypothetical protein ABSD46_08375 [Bacteroidota bacterium]
MKSKIYGIMIILYCLQFPFLQGQTRYERQEAVGQIIDAELKSLYGPKYSAPFVFEIDSLLGYNAYFSNPLDDPYGTLKNCFIFIGCPDENLQGNIVGVYKDGNVLWHSEILKCGEGLRLYTTMDLTNDGTVDLVFESGVPNYGDTWGELWIFSWNGQTGNRINAMDADGGSSIRGGRTNFSFVDVEGDGVWEIADESDEEGTSGWSWNGQEYGHWANTPNTNILFPLRNKIDVTVICRVIKNVDTLLFNYEVFNKPTSKQRVVDFKVWCLTMGVSSIHTPPYWSGGYINGRKFIWWNTITDYTTGHIRVGRNMNGFIVKAKSLCAISHLQLHGYNGHGRLKRSDFVDKAALITKDELENAFMGKTIGPADPPNPFVPLNFLDTLTNYTTQSRSLGWIKDNTTASKYLDYFSSARTKLVQHDSVGARTVLLQVLKDVDIDSTTSLSSEAYALLRFNTEYLANILPQAQAAPFFAVKLVSSTGAKLISGTLQYYDGSWKDATNNQDGTFSIDTKLKNLSLRMTYEYGTQTKSNVSISNDTIVFQTVNAQIQLQNSSGTLIDAGSVQYYAGAWRNLGTTVNGTATKELLPASYSFRMTYAYASKDKQQDLNTNATVVFQTVNAAVKLQNSQGALMDQGTVQYYSGAWRDFGTTTNGAANKELLPNNYSFRMTYAYASKDKQQDIGTNPTVVFQTVNAAVQLKNSQGALMPAPLGDQGTVQYYSGAWRDLGITTNGIANKELLPNNYSFRMTYAYASKDKQQDIGTNATVVFQTVNAAVQLQNSQGALMPAPLGDQGTVQYYSGAWRDLGATTNGVASKELLPNNYSFRMTYAYASKDKQQDIGANPTVVFQTVNAAVQLKNSLGNLIDLGTVQYYSGAWRPLGVTTNGTATKELLPNNYSFRMTYEYVSVDKSQDLSANSTVSFSTVLCTIRVKNAQNQLVNNALASYYSGAWRQIGNTVNGVITKELLPVNLSFRVKYGTQQQDKEQNLSTNNVVEFGIQ